MSGQPAIFGALGILGALHVLDTANEDSHRTHSSSH
jgi:hypothetical protein